MNLRYAAVALSAAALTLGLAACGGSDDSSSDDAANSGLDTINSGKLTVCTDAPYPPFDVIDGSTFSGFDGELVTAIGKELGLTVVPLDTGFDAIESGLAVKTRQCDMSASAMTMTDERKANIAFSDPYYDSKQSLLVPAGSSIKSIDDLAGKKVGVQKDTTGETYAKEHATGADIVSFPDDAAEFTALQGGSVDALLQDLPVNLEHTKDGKYTIAEQYDTSEQYGFGFNKTGQEDLVKAFNDGLAKLRSDGTYDTIYKKYFSVG